MQKHSITGLYSSKNIKIFLKVLKICTRLNEARDLTCSGNADPGWHTVLRKRSKCRQLAKLNMNCGLDTSILLILCLLIFYNFTVVLQKNVFVFRKYILKLYVYVFLGKWLFYVYKYTCIYRGQRERERENKWSKVYQLMM